MHSMAGNGGGFMMGFWWILIIALVAALLFWIANPAGKIGKQGSALDILEKRYARGEISDSEFKTMKNKLSSKGVKS